MNTETKTIASVKGQLPGPRSRDLFSRWEKVEAQCTGYQAKVVWDQRQGRRRHRRRRQHVPRLDLGRAGDQRRPLSPASGEGDSGRGGRKLLNNYECLNEPRVEAAEKLVSILPKHLDKCFFLTTGSEATEGCHPHHEAEDGQVRNRQLLRRFSRPHRRRGQRRRPVGTKEGLWADRARRDSRAVSRTATAAPSKRSPKPATCFASTMSMMRCAPTAPAAWPGVIVEAYQGAAGFIFAPKGWFPRLEQWIRSRGLLFTLDEVQSGYRPHREDVRDGVGEPDAGPGVPG